MFFIGTIKKALVSKYVGSAIRHILTTATGYLVAQNVIEAEVAETLIEQVSVWALPVALGLLGLGSSVVEKKKR